MKEFEIDLDDFTLAPGRLIVLTRRDGVVKRFIDALDAGLAETTTIAIDGNDYTVLEGLNVSAVRQTLGGEAPSVEITGSHGLGEMFDTDELAAGRYDGATVQIYIVDFSNLDEVATPGLMFTGIVGPQKWDYDGLFSLDCRGLAEGAKGVYVPTFSPMCRTDLFSPLCQLVASSFDQSGTVGSIVNKHNITVAGLMSPPADGYFNGGTLESASGVKIEIANWVQSTTLMTFYLEIHKLLEVGEGLTIYPGCDKTMGANGCGKFSNWINFQGEPHYLGSAAASASG